MGFIYSTCQKYQNIPWRICCYPRMVLYLLKKKINIPITKRKTAKLIPFKNELILKKKTNSIHFFLFTMAFINWHMERTWGLFKIYDWGRGKCKKNKTPPVGLMLTFTNLPLLIHCRCLRKWKYTARNIFCQTRNKEVLTTTQNIGISNIVQKSINISHKGWSGQY